jgi:hypothetical protein
MKGRSIFNESGGKYCRTVLPELFMDSLFYIANFIAKKKGLKTI